MTRSSYRSILAGFGCLAVIAAATAQGPTVEADQAASTAGMQQPGMRHELPGEAVSVEGLIRLDAAVADEAGEAVPGLRRTDFKVYDNGQPQNIIAFRESNGISANPDDSLTIILLLDTLDLSADLTAVERQQTVEFLRRSAGHLSYPVAIYSLDDSGFFLTAKSSTDTDMLARDVTSNNKVDAYFLAPHVRSQFKTAVVDPLFGRIPALTGLRALGTIAAAEDANPGRKLLLWIGPGLSDRGTGAYAPNGKGLMSSIITPGKKSRESERDLFEKIRWFSTVLRQARVTVDCLSVADDEQANDSPWKQYLAGVPSAEQAHYMNLYKKVLTVQTGGRVLQASGNLARQLDDCVHHAGIYYTLTFNPPLAAHPDEYHSVKVDLSHPGLIVRTSTGYYDQPFYDDPPDPAIRTATGAQLQQIIQGNHGAPLARELSTLTLTDRLSSTRLQSLSALVPANKLRESLEMIADESAFLEPPASEVPGDPPPDPTGQQKILAAATDYLGHVIPKLPDFFATRTAVYYWEVAAYPGLDTATASMPLHAEQRTKSTVLYRHGVEIVEPLTAGPVPADGRSLTTFGTFGPILTVVQAVLKTPGSVTWQHWESGVTGRIAVFHFAFAGNPMVNLVGCCFPDGHGKSPIGLSASSHGEIAIDPSTGAILRVHIEADLGGFVTLRRSGLVVSYGPVEISGKTYILPLRSVNIVRGRTVVRFSQWNLGFPTWGPYETQMNVFTFDGYHMFQGSGRMLPGFDPRPEK